MLHMQNEFGSFSKIFRILLCLFFAMYVCGWFFTMHLAAIQKEKSIQPILPVLREDSEEYAALSESLLLRQSFTQDGKIETLRAPGYPAFIALLRSSIDSFFLVTAVQVVLVFISAIFVRKLGIFFASKRVGEIAAILFLSNPVTFYLSLVILTDVPFLFLLICGFYLVVSNRRISTIIIASILFGFAVYVRPMGIFALPIFITPVLVSGRQTRQKVFSVSMLAVIIALMIFPWMYRNYRSVGVFDFTSFKAINLAFYVAPMFLSHLHHTGVTDERARIERETGIPQEKWKELAYSAPLSAAAEKIILAHPFSYALYHAESSLPFLFASPIQEVLNSYRASLDVRVPFETGSIGHLVNREWGLFFQSITKDWWKLLERLLMGFAYLIAAYGFFTQRRNPLAWAFIFIPAYLMLLSGPAANARYAIQASPFLLLLFAAGILRLVDRLRVLRYNEVSHEKGNSD